MVASDIGWSIQCPDKCIRHLPYQKEEDAEFDVMYLTARGCFDYSGVVIKPFKPVCPQGEHHKVMSMFDLGSAATGALIGPCDIIGCLERSRWRAGLIVVSQDGSVEIECSIAIKTCDLHQSDTGVSDLISEREWSLMTRQFKERGIDLPEPSGARLSFQELRSKV